MMSTQEQLQALADGTMSVSDINTENLSAAQSKKAKATKKASGSGNYARRYKAMIAKMFNYNGDVAIFYKRHLRHRSSHQTFPALMEQQT